MSSSVWYNDETNWLSFGTLGRVDFVPAGHQVWTIMYLSNGVNKVDMFFLLCIIDKKEINVMLNDAFRNMSLIVYFCQ